jgi:hypothetical protein
MRRTAAAAAITAALFAAAAGTAGAAGAKHTATLSYKVHFSPFFIVDNGKKGYSKGDQIIASDLLIGAGGKTVGHTAVACTLTDPKIPEASCAITFVLAGGIITGQYANTPPARKVVAITGGTGKYVGARGEVVIVEFAKGPVGTATFTVLT